MKKTIAIMLGLALALSLAACGQPGAASSQPVTSDPSQETEAVSIPPMETPDTSASQPDQTTNPNNEVGGKTLVVYFSATGSTQKVAGYIADTLVSYQVRK